LPYDLHSLFHKHKNIPVEEEQLRNEDLWYAKVLQCTANAGKDVVAIRSNAE